MHAERAREGYLLIDNTVSGGARMEAAVTTCAHCQVQVIRNPARVRERARCWKCNHYICDACGAVGDCRPFVKLIQELGA